MFELPFLEQTTPPPFYRADLTPQQRTRLDKWFIGERSQDYYLKRFAQMDQAGRLLPKWHWAAFFMTFGWLLYRKRYLDCLVYCVAGWSFIKLNIVIVLSMSEFLFIRLLPAAYQMPVRVAIGLGIWLFWAGMVARWADAYYYRMARREIADALDAHPRDLNAQQAHLAHEGQVSLLGMSVAFALFGTLLAIIALQFVPIIAMQKERALIDDSYYLVNQARQQVAHIYQAQGCPVGISMMADTQKVSMEVVGALTGRQTDCAVVLTITKAGYPVRYLNGQTLVMYRSVDDGKWRCQTSLNKKKAPMRCLS